MNNNVNESLQKMLNETDDNDLINDADIDTIVSQVSSRKKSELTVGLQQKEEKPAFVEHDDPITNLGAIMDESKKLSEEMKVKQEQYMQARDVDLKDPKDFIDNEAEVLKIIEDIEDSEASIEEESVQSDDIEEILQKYEDSKVYSDYEKPKDYAGPSQYVIETDDEYTSRVESIMSENNIRFDKVTKTEKNAVLNAFTNSGTNVSVMLPNSGIFVKMSGAGVGELIAMSKLSNDNAITQQVEKLQHISNHIVDTSVGPLKLQDLMNIISYYDISTLYYALFAATHPDTVEISRECPDCGEQYFLNMDSHDLLLNGDELEKYNHDILSEVTTYRQLLDNSKLSKVYKKLISNGMLIYYKHPSIRSFLNTYNKLEQPFVEKYQDIAAYAFCIDKICIANPDKKGSYVQYTNPNEIITIISRIKDADTIYEIGEMVESVRESVIPSYGYQKSTCPYCNAKNPKQSVQIDSLLFTVARDEYFVAGMKSKIRLDKRKKEQQMRR